MQGQHHKRIYDTFGFVGCKLSNKDGSRHWMHVSYINLNSWLWVGLPMRGFGDAPHQGTMVEASPHVRPWAVHWDILDGLNFTQSWSMELWALGGSAVERVMNLRPCQTLVRFVLGGQFWPPPLPRRHVPLRMPMPIPRGAGDPPLGPDHPGDGKGRGRGRGGRRGAGVARGHVHDQGLAPVMDGGEDAAEGIVEDADDSDGGGDDEPLDPDNAGIDGAGGDADDLDEVSRAWMGACSLAQFKINENRDSFHFLCCFLHLIPT
jgi:hypothetical protein